MITAVFVLIGGAGWLATICASAWTVRPQDGANSAQQQSLQSGSYGNADTPQDAHFFDRSRTGHLAAATSPPEPAPPSLAEAAPLRPHEVFGFAPYWTLPSSGGFDVDGISTLAYFSIDLNSDGTLQESGAGWNGYESQDLADLVTRAHAAGDRVVLTVTDFDQGSLNALTSSPTAAATLASALVGAVSAKNLDGVNLDLEGEGAGDQSGLTRLVTVVSSALHAANPHYQLTMDTYASSATDPGGFYDIRALSPLVDAFFVMEYSPNLAATPSNVSPLTNGLFSDQTTVDEYASVVPPSKVILGLPYFGIDWPTTNGTLMATATGPASDVSVGDVLASGHPLYWDPVTDSGWTSYHVGTQWHETFFEDPTSLYDAAELAQSHNFAGVGIWALGMDGNDLYDLAALCGFAPTVKGGPAGPALDFPAPPASTTSPTTSSVSPSTTTTTSRAPVTTTTARTSTTTTSTSTSTTSTTTTTQPGGTYSYSGIWDGAQVNLSLVSGSEVPTTEGSAAAGQLAVFQSDDPSVTCLSQSSPLAVWAVSGTPDEYLVIATSPGDCVNADFVFNTA
jgi:hypothetical protein